MTSRSQAPSSKQIIKTIRHLLIDRGLTIQDLADIWGINRISASKIMRGQAECKEKYLKILSKKYEIDFRAKWSAPASKGLAPTDSEIGRTIKHFMLDHDLRTKDVAKIWKMTRQQTAAILAGRQAIRIKHLRVLSEKYGENIRIFFG